MTDALGLWVYRTPGEVHVAIAHTDEEATALCNIPPPEERHHWEVEVLPLTNGPLHVLSSPPESIGPDVRAELTQAKRRNEHIRALREKLVLRRAKRRALRVAAMRKPRKPRYDEVYFDGVAWLDAL